MANAADKLKLDTASELTYSVMVSYSDYMGETSILYTDLSAQDKTDFKNLCNYVLSNSSITIPQFFTFWKAHLINNGWVYGLTRSTYLKLEPLLVDYVSLSSIQRYKFMIPYTLLKQMNGITVTA